MPFTTTRESAPATNVDIKQEKALLEKQLVEVQTRIEEKEKQHKKMKDMTDELTNLQNQHDRLTEQVLGATSNKKTDEQKRAKFAVELAKIKAETVEAVGILQEILKKITEDSLTLKAIHQTISQAKRDLEAVNLKKQSVIKEVTKNEALVSSAVGEFHQQVATTNALVKKQTEIETKVTEIKKLFISISSQIDEKQKEFEKVAEKTKKVEEKVESATNQAKEIVANAQKRVDELMNEAERVLHKKRAVLDEREGAVSLRESWNQTKQDKLKEIKSTLEAHLGKKLNIVFPD